MKRIVSGLLALTMLSSVGAMCFAQGERNTYRCASGSTVTCSGSKTEAVLGTFLGGIIFIGTGVLLILTSLGLIDAECVTESESPINPEVNTKQEAVTQTNIRVRLNRPCAERVKKLEIFDVTDYIAGYSSAPQKVGFTDVNVTNYHVQPTISLYVPSDLIKAGHVYDVVGYNQDGAMCLCERVTADYLFAGRVVEA